jgi:hypothetical protein
MPRCFLAAKLKYPYIKWKEGQEEGGGNRTGAEGPVAEWRIGGPGCPLVVQRQKQEEEEEVEEEALEVEEVEEKEMIWWKGVRTEGLLKSMNSPFLVLIQYIYSRFLNFPFHVHCYKKLMIFTS